MMHSMESYQEWEEGSQKILFPSTWQVVKVDQHPYYRQVSGQGLKSVDFLALDPEWGLYFIELKDYRHQLSVEEKADLQEVFEEKLEDSKLLIRSVYAMLHKKWYYKICLRYEWLYRLVPKRSKFWIEAYAYVLSGCYTCLVDVADGNDQ